MIPQHSQQTAKRKASEDSNPLINAAKRVRRETSAKSNKRKLNGEEQPGGLVIVRAPSERPSPATLVPHADPFPPSHPPSRPPSAQPPAGPSKQPTKKFRADSAARPTAKSKDHELLTSTRAEPDVEEDVRIMQSETDTIRRRTQAAQSSIGLNPAYRYPSAPPRSQPHLQPRSPPIRDLSQPLQLQETPQIEKNKIMRDGGHTRRRSSVSRGKRISTSFETTGVIGGSPPPLSGLHARPRSLTVSRDTTAQPHTSVSNSSFYKHIDVDLPEPYRARQLLIWSAHRAMNELTEEQGKQAVGKSKRKSQGSGKDPPLEEPDNTLLKHVEADVIRMLAEKRIDTNVYSSGHAEEGEAAPTVPTKENEQNVKNRAREIKFNAYIQQSKAEEDAWAEVAQFYNQRQKTGLMDIEKQRQQATSAKAKGKQRATNDWDVLERDLPEHFHGRSNLELARSIMTAESGHKSPLSQRLEELHLTVDRLHSFASAALEATHIAESDLDRRFASLNISLAARSQPPPSLSPTYTDHSSYLPSTLTRPSPTTDPQALLRALSVVDAGRPQTQVGDAARRAAREVQRAHDASNGMAERRLTGVPPPTPRKPPGTPRRATTPGKGR